MSPVRLSAKPSATVWRPHPKRVSARRGLPPQCFTAISASKARRFGPLIWDAARRRSAICDGLSDGRHSSVESRMHMIGPLERNRGNLPEGSSEHAYCTIVISFPEIALEPEWEAKLSPHTYGFRPGRSCWDAIAAIFTGITFRPQYALKADIAKCFDRICHEALLAKTQAPPVIRRQLKAWLNAGILQDGYLVPTTAGTPQGGSISPLLALIALHGIDEAITKVYPRARVVVYADDCVVLHEDHRVLAHCQQLLTTWLAAMGLTVNEAKSHLHHTL